MANPRKRYQVAKFYGREWSVVDVIKNATVGVHLNRQAAKVVAEALNKRRPA